MPTAYEQTGRTRQKARTRTALVAAARELLAEGIAPGVEQAADRAGVSRSTAYRYFPNEHALVAATYPELDAESLLGDSPPDDPLERLDVVTERIGRQLVEHEPELRAQLRLALSPGAAPADPLPLRRGRAVGWIEEALEPLRGALPRRELRRLALAVRAAIGIEPFVWLVDVAGSSRPEAIRIMRASARAIVEVAIARTAPSPSRARR